MQQHRWHTLGDITKGIWIIGLADASRSDVFSYSDPTVPENGLTLELLQKKDGLLADSQQAVLTGQQKVWYWDETQQKATDNPLTLPPRLAFTDSAVLDEETLNTLAAYLSAEHLQSAGYLQSGYLFARPGEQGRQLWIARHGITTYASARHFYLPETYRATYLTGKSTVTRDAYDCVIIRLEDAAELTVTAEYDWRFLTAVRVTDANDNVQTVTLDALGRMIRLRTWGTENGLPVGYSDTPVNLPQKADDALRLNAPLPAAQCLVYVADSWRQTETEKLPPHVVILTTDRYDDDPAQQIRQQVVFSDGFGRVLQTAVRQADGAAWQRHDNGSLAADKTEKKLTVVTTAFLWAVSGRIEYDSKGQPIRAYQPYFLDSWKYVSDDSARRDLFADTHYYDPTGREYQVITAKGWLRRRQFTPWFVISEDENDTATQSGYSV